MGIDKSVRSVAQVLLFSDEARSLELAPILWPALQEVAAFWGSLPGAPTFSHYLWGRVPFGNSTIAGLGVLEQPRDFSDQQWQRSRGRYSGTVDLDCLASVVRNMFTSSPDVLVVVTDRELMPPKESRYLIADDTASDDGTSVVSTAPVDPCYWSQSTSNRLAIIKHRIRSVMLGIVGEWLELEACDNPQCVMCEYVNSVYALDSMVLLGEEHPVPELTLKGFDPRPENPASMQHIVERPVPPSSMAM